MWAFLLLVIIIILILFVPAFFATAPPTIKQPLILTADSQTLSIGPNQTSILDFTVANLNTTNTISTTANATLRPASQNINLTILGVKTGNGSLVVSSDGKTVSFPPGGNILEVRVTSNSKVPLPAASYMVTVSLAN